MEPDSYSIGELADAAGLSRRAVRFYVQRGLLPPPLTRGRGARYGAEHVVRLREIGQLQAAGHSLDAIARVLAARGPTAGVPSGEPVRNRNTVRVPDSPVDDSRPVPAVRVQAQLLTRIRLQEGVELLLDASRYNPTGEALMALRQSVQELLKRGGTP
jgi:DNA-binding transcriptional MerR regulator